MATITGISAQKKKKDRVNIYLDGRFYCGMEGVTLLSHNLTVGSQIEEAELEQLQLESEASVAFDKALTRLAVRMRSQKEMQDYLKEKGYLPLVIDETIKKLKSYGYINDISFANELVRCYPSLGMRALKEKLKQKGVSDEIIKSVLVEDEEQEEQKAYLAALKFTKSRQNVKNIKEKLLRHLAGKGFNYEICAKVTRKTTKDEEN